MCFLLLFFFRTLNFLLFLIIFVLCSKACTQAIGYVYWKVLKVICGALSLNGLFG